MNEADPSPINLDELRLVPDWMREEGPPPSKQYASHPGDSGDFGPRRGPRPGGFNRDRPPGRGPGGGSGGGARRPEGGRRDGPPARGGAGRPERDDRRPPRPEAPVAPAPVRVDFLPDEKCLASIVKQIRSTHLAYPLFGLARMFLQEPARHWVQFTLLPDANVLALYQLGEDGPITTDQAVLERIAYESAKDRYYVEQSEQKEPPKGNFTSVARNRLSGALLGPTNYHGYQPALRVDYESKYSRRMSFEDYRRNIEIVNDPAVVERWKEDARTSTTIATREGEPPTVLPTPADARVHFRQHYFDALAQTGTMFKVHGSIARNLPEPAMMQAIRQAHDVELRYPAQFVQSLRQGLQNAGLHIFKHRKRVVYVSVSRPSPFAPDGAVSPDVAAILDTVAKFPLCNRKFLAECVLSRQTVPASGPVAPAEPAAELIGAADQARAQEILPDGADPDATVAASPAAPVDDPLAKVKSALAADLRFLVQAGHLIEFHNGTFDLPLPPKAKEELVASGKTPAAASSAPAEAAPAAAAIDPVAVEAEREVLTVDSVDIIAPEPALEPFLEKVEAQVVSEPGTAVVVPGSDSAPQLAVAPDPLVIGDAVSAHPLSPS